MTGCQRIPAIDYDGGDGGLGTDEPDSSPGGSLEPVYNCDPVDQNDCGDDQKCTPLDKYGKQNYYDCVDDDGLYNTFESCEPAKNTGQDRCRAGTVCLADYTEQGICVNLCLDDKDCNQGLCIKDPKMGVDYCADECLPFAPAGCLSLLECRRETDRTVCQFATEEDDGITGDECGSRMGDRGCRDGFACLAGSVVTGCQSIRCCARFCDLNSEEPQCSDPDSCNPAFDDPAPPSESVGACYVPTQG